MPTAIGSFTQLRQFIDGILSTNGDSPVLGPHKQFWDNLTYQQFTTGDVPGIVDPNTNLPMKILVVGNSQASNIILALSGAAGTLFDPHGRIGPMPEGGTLFTVDQIASIASWIDAGCPQ
jgi:hypothetical protein